MADIEPTTPSPSPRRTRTGEIIDATTGGIERIGKMNSQHVVTVVAMIGMTFICMMLAFQAYSEREERKEERKERQESDAIRVREANAQSELLRNHCAAENDRTRRDSADQVKNILVTFLAEGEKNRTHLSSENEKFRREVLTALKAPPVNGP